MRLALLALLAAGCSPDLSFGRYSAAPDARVPSSHCAAEGPRFALGDGDRACATPGFHHALCSCGDYVSSDETRADGSLAVGGGLSAGSLTIDGALIVAGSQGAPLTGDLDVGGSLWSAGPVQGPHAVRVAGDAHIVGAVRLARFSVGGTLSLPEGAALEVGEGAVPPVQRGSSALLAPCDCTPAVDVNAEIEAARAANDDAAIGLEPARGLRTFEQARELDLPCGSYYVEQIYAASPITLRVHGPVRLHVRDRIVTERASSLTIALDANATLDLFLGQGITGAGPIRIDAAPSAMRLYVQGDSLFFAAPLTLAGTLYAPRSELVTQSTFELHGAALVARVAAEGPVLLRQEQALGGDCAR